MGEERKPQIKRPRIDLMDIYTYKEFSINAPNVTADEFSKKALEQLKKSAAQSVEAERSKLVKGGYLATIEEVTHKFNKSGISQTLRYLISEEGLYIKLLSKVILKENVTDVSGIYSRVKANAQETKAEFYYFLTQEVLSANSIDVDSISFDQLFADVVKLKPKINNSESTIMDVLHNLEKLGNLPKLVDFYFLKEEVDSSKGTSAVKKAMSNYLLSVGLVVPDDYNPNIAQPSKYDEALFVAYTNAIRRIGEGSDPINNLFSASSDDNWDFQVDDFESIEGQGIDSESIKVASVLFYIYKLGDELGIFKIVDAIILAWTQGRLDIPQGDSAHKLYKYYKLREERTAEEERGVFYGQVLNLGATNMLEGMTVNEDFTRLWQILMEEAVNYIQKFENSDSGDSISKMPMYRAMQDIQYNLSTHSSGMVKAMTREMYAHLNSAIEILQEQEVVDQLGYGYNKSMWKVIEQVSRTEFNVIPNVSALKTGAVEGNKILRTIADFDEASITDAEFTTLLNSCESFIISQSQLMDQEEYSEEGIEEFEETIDNAGDDWDF